MSSVMVPECWKRRSVCRNSLSSPAGKSAFTASEEVSATSKSWAPERGASRSCFNKSDLRLRYIEILSCGILYHRFGNKSAQGSRRALRAFVGGATATLKNLPGAEMPEGRGKTDR